MNREKLNKFFNIDWNNRRIELITWKEEEPSLVRCLKRGLKIEKKEDSIHKIIHAMMTAGISNPQKLVVTGINITADLIVNFVEDLLIKNDGNVSKASESVGCSYSSITQCDPPKISLILYHCFIHSEADKKLKELGQHRNLLVRQVNVAEETDIHPRGQCPIVCVEKMLQTIQTIHNEV